MMTYKRLYRIVRRNKPVKMLEKIVLNYATADIYLRDRLESVFLSKTPDERYHHRSLVFTHNDSISRAWI